MGRQLIVDCGERIRVYGIDNPPAGTTTEQVQQVYGGGFWHDAMTAVGVSGTGSGHWEFDSEEMAAVIKKWEGLLDDLKEDRRKIRDIQRAMRIRPSDDESTKQYCGRVHDGVNALDESNTSMLSYVNDYIDRLKKAKSDLEESDESAGKAVRSTEI